jgi:tripartite-type tricarboxylate transporter receptor subunit TctC
VAVASPDGYTLLLGSSTALAMNPVMYRRLSYDPLTQLAPVSLIALQPMAILVHPSVPAQTLPELVALAKAKPRGLFYGATGSSIQLATEYFAAQTGTKFEAVNYKGNAEGLTDLAAGRIQVLFDAVPTSIPFVQSGRARALAVTSRSRSPGLPGVPTVAELGLPAEFDVTLLFALMAPEGTPPEIVQRLNAEMRKVLASAEVKDRLARQGVEPQASTPQQLHDRIRSEIERWRKVVKDADIKIEE